MSYERQRYVIDGQEAIGADDIYARDATKGPLIHGVGGDGTVYAIRVRSTSEIASMDLEVREALQQVIVELKKMNMHLLSITDEQISEPDIDSTY